MEIKVKKLDPIAKLPYRGSRGAAGYDVFALEETVIKPQTSLLLRTGIALEVPSGHFVMLCPRGSIIKREFLDQPNSVGIFDSDYRGEVFVPMRNLHLEQEIKIAKHERIAQIILQRYEAMDFAEVDKLSDTERGEGKLGSTGKF